MKTQCFLWPKLILYIINLNLRLKGVNNSVRNAVHFDKKKVTYEETARHTVGVATAQSGGAADGVCFTLLFVNLKQERQYTYNITLRRLCETIVAMETQYYILWEWECVFVCVCSLHWPTCIVNASYCHIWSLRLYHIFPHYLIKGTTFD